MNPPFNMQITCRHLLYFCLINVVYFNHTLSTSNYLCLLSTSFVDVAGFSIWVQKYKKKTRGVKMMKLMKTRAVSEKIGVHPTTIQRWVKFFDLDWRKNDHGHYLFTDEDIAILQEIKQQLEHGLSLSEINVPMRKRGEQGENIEEKKVNRDTQVLEQRITELETVLAQKADEIVYFQVLQQRKEIETLAATISTLEDKIESIERQLATSQATHDEVAYEPRMAELTRSAKPTLLRRMFSFFV